jgi:hypothetical protein
MQSNNLPVQLEPQLQVPRLEGGTDHSEGRRRYIITRQREVGVVGQIERLELNSSREVSDMRNSATARSQG